MEERPVEVVKKAILSMAGSDCDKAATIAVAALNEAYAESGLVFRIEVMGTVFGEMSHESQLREIVQSVFR